MIARFVIIFSMVLVFGSGCVTENRGPIPRDSVFKVRDTDIDFSPTGWKFFWGTEGELGMPIDAFVNLYAERDGNVFRIKKPSDIKKLGSIRIGSTNEALFLVRMFTDKTKYTRFTAPGGIEYPDNNATIEQRQGVFIIRRRLLSLTTVGEKGFPAREVMEMVFPDGEYRCKTIKNLQPLRERPPNVPMIE